MTAVKASFVKSVIVDSTRSYAPPVDQRSKIFATQVISATQSAPVDSFRVRSRTMSTPLTPTAAATQPITAQEQLVQSAEDGKYYLRSTQYVVKKAPEAGGLPETAPSSTPTTPALQTVRSKAVGSSKGLRFETLKMSSSVFSPSSLAVKSQILKHLGCSSSASIQELENPGGCNKGIWTLRDGDQKLILKLIGNKRKYPHVPTDTEKCVQLAQKHPDIESDHSFTFPSMIFKCCQPGGDEVYDLSVMREASGLRLADIIAIYYRTKQSQLDDLVDIFRRFGTFLARFHATYQMQHGDCHASNVFYDESSNLFTLIDVADMSPSPYGSDDDDVTYFNGALLTLSEYYGSNLLTKCGLKMRAGYKEGLNILSVSTPTCATTAPLRASTTPRAEVRRHTVASATVSGADKSSSLSTGLKVVSLKMSSTTFDPTLSFTKAQILMHLDCSPSASIEELPNPGGCNKGIWILRGSKQNLVLKLIDSKRKHEHLPTDTEKCQTLFTKHPQIGTDNSLAFPFIIFKCCEPGGNESYDLSVMREAPGFRLADVIAIYYRTQSERLDDLLEIFRSFGSFLAAFHHAYQMQHGDCHASNVFYDEGSNQFTIIDVADLGVNPYGNGEDDDITYFNKGLLTLGVYYTTELMTSCGQSLVTGYKEQMDSSAQMPPKNKLASARTPPASVTPSKSTSSLPKVEVDRQSVGMSGPTRNATPITPPRVNTESAPNHPTRVSITTKPGENFKTVSLGTKPVENSKAKTVEYRLGQAVEVLRSSGLWIRGEITSVEHHQCTITFGDESHKSIPTASLQQLVRPAAEEILSQEEDEPTVLMSGEPENVGAEEDKRLAHASEVTRADVETEEHEVLEMRDGRSNDFATVVAERADRMQAEALSSDSTPGEDAKGVGPETSQASLNIETLHLSNGTFDPLVSGPELLEHLGVPDATIQEMPNPGGGSKGIKGIWVVTGGKSSFTLKLMSSKRKYASIPTVTEKCDALASNCPNIKNDLSVCFPFMIFRCSGTDEHEAYDLLVMREAPGKRLTDIIAYRNSQGRLDDLVNIFRKFGSFLAGFHASYQMQHGHCHPSNVFYDESTSKFTLTDVTNMEANPYAGGDDDVTYFNRALMTLKEYYGSALIVRCSASVVAGFKEHRRLI